MKRKRGHECDVCEKVFRYPSHLARTCILIRTRNRMCVRNAMKRHKRIHTNEKAYECVCDKAFRQATHLKSTCVFTRTRNRTNVMCARNVLLNLVVYFEKAQCSSI